jgi:hypothetical protein
MKKHLNGALDRMIRLAERVDTFTRRALAALEPDADNLPADDAAFAALATGASGRSVPAAVAAVAAAAPPPSAAATTTAAIADASVAPAIAAGSASMDF